MCRWHTNKAPTEPAGENASRGMSGNEGMWEPSHKKGCLGEESPSLTPPVTLSRATFSAAAPVGALIVCHWHTAPSKREAPLPQKGCLGEGGCSPTPPVTLSRATPL